MPRRVSIEAPQANIEAMAKITEPLRGAEKDIGNEVITAKKTKESPRSLLVNLKSEEFSKLVYLNPMIMRERILIITSNDRTSNDRICTRRASQNYGTLSKAAKFSCGTWLRAFQEIR